MIRTLSSRNVNTHHVKTPTYEPDGNQARFAVGAPGVRHDARRLPLETRCGREIHPVFGKIGRTLGSVPKMYSIRFL
jgi:hypothetical protein